MPSKFQQSDGVMEMLANEVANFLAVQLVDQITSPDIWICCDCYAQLTIEKEHALTHNLCVKSAQLYLCFTLALG